MNNNDLILTPLSLVYRATEAAAAAAAAAAAETCCVHKQH